MGETMQITTLDINEDRPMDLHLDNNIPHQDQSPVNSPDQEEVYREVADRLKQIGDIVDREFLSETIAQHEPTGSLFMQIGSWVSVTPAQVSLMVMNHLRWSVMVSTVP